MRSSMGKKPEKRKRKRRQTCLREKEEQEKKLFPKLLTKKSKPQALHVTLSCEGRRKPYKKV